MTDACPQCGSTVWTAAGSSAGPDFAVEKRECERGHRWTVVLS